MMEEKSIKALMRRLSGVMGECQALIEETEGTDKLALRLAQPSLEAAYKVMLIASAQLFPASALVTRKPKKEDKPPKQLHGEFCNVFLTEGEYSKLKYNYGDEVAERYIEALSGYIESKQVKYANHYATILSFMRRDGITQKGKEKPSTPLTKQMMKSFLEK